MAAHCAFAQKAITKPSATCVCSVAKGLLSFRLLRSRVAAKEQADDCYLKAHGLICESPWAMAIGLMWSADWPSHSASPGVHDMGQTYSLYIRRDAANTLDIEV